MNGRHGGNSLDSDAAHDAVRSGRQLSGCLSVVNGRKKQMNIQIIRSNRKTAVIQVWQDQTVKVRVPRSMPEEAVRQMIKRKELWIREQLEKMKRLQEQEQAAEQNTQRFTGAELQNLADQALKVIPERTAYYAPIVGVTYGRITIRGQKTRWGSCNSKGNLNFNCLLMLAPPEVLDYVVVHELCHRKEMNHSKTFWKEVEKVLPDYRKAVRWLKENGGELMKRRG